MVRDVTYRDLDVADAENMTEDEFAALLGQCDEGVVFCVKRDGEDTGCVLIGIDLYTRLVGQRLTGGSDET